jgi:pseudaminic acid cytidylyltransferase
MRVAIIPARSGSKRIPDKNIKDFLGKPMISYPLAALTKSNLFDQIIVSTDSQEYGEIAKNFGATLIDVRPNYLSDDQSGLLSVYNYLVERYSLRSCTSLTSLMPCSPFISTNHISDAVNRLETHSVAKSLMAVSQFEVPPEWALEIKNDLVKFMHKRKLIKNYKSLNQKYYDAGSLYIYKPQYLNSKNKIVTKGILPFILPKNIAIDIDNLEDWQKAEQIGLVAKNLVKPLKSTMANRKVEK